MLNPKHRASRSALRGCQLLRDSQKRGKSTKEFFSGKKRNGTISFKFFFGTGGRKKAYARYWERGHQKVSKQTGGIGCIKPQYSEDTYFMDGDS